MIAAAMDHGQGAWLVVEVGVIAACALVALVRSL